MNDDPKAQRLHFTCPECGFGDAEWGHLALLDDTHCMVCHMDDGRSVRLRRWSAAAETEPTAPSTPG